MENCKRITTLTSPKETLKKSDTNEKIIRNHAKNNKTDVYYKIAAIRIITVKTGFPNINHFGYFSERLWH